MFGRDEKVSGIRLTAAQYIILGVFLVLAYGLWRLQVMQSDYYSLAAEKTRIRNVPVLAPRGKILDRNGRVIVDNYPSFSALLLRDSSRDLAGDADLIGQGLHIDPNEVRARIRRFVHQQQRQQHVDVGRAELTKAFRQAGVDGSEKALEPALKTLKYGTVDDLYVAVGNGNVGVQTDANSDIEAGHDGILATSSGGTGLLPSSVTVIATGFIGKTAAVGGDGDRDAHGGHGQDGDEGGDHRRLSMTPPSPCHTTVASGPRACQTAR